jgi:adenylate cyclase
MAHEIERKFLVISSPPEGATEGHDRLRQAYLAVDGTVEVRLRDVDGATTLTVKAGSGLVRTEVELAVRAADAAELWPHADDRSLEKVRHRVMLEEHLVAELDVYEGPLAGLRTVEVEFPDPAAAEAFVAPAWFGREITGEQGWSNAELAQHGLPRDADLPDVR